MGVTAERAAGVVGRGSPLAGHVVDARGRRIRLLLLAGVPASANGDLEIAEQTWARIQQRAGEGGTTTTRDYVLGGLVAIPPWVLAYIAVAKAAPSFTRGFWGSSATRAVLIISMMIVGTAYARWRAQSRHARAVAAAFLGEGYCPSCGYGIGGIRADADGCTVCPECGAAWGVDEEQTC